MEIEYYAVAHHGTAGLGNSYGMAYVREYHKDMYGGRPQSDQTTTVWGPYTKERAEVEVARMRWMCSGVHRSISFEQWLEKGN